MSLKKKFPKKNFFTLFCPFGYFLPSFINEKLDNKLSVFEKKAFEHFSSAKVGFTASGNRFLANFN